VRGKELFFPPRRDSRAPSGHGALVSIYLSENYGRKLSLVSNMGQILFSLTGNFFQISGLKKTSGRFKKTFSELSFESKNEIDFIDDFDWKYCIF
jgi:hypothetical protein